MRQLAPVTNSAGSSPAPYLNANLRRFEAATESARYSVSNDLNGSVARFAYRNPSTLRAATNMFTPGAVRVPGTPLRTERAGSMATSTGVSRSTATPMSMDRGAVPSSMTRYSGYTGPLTMQAPSVATAANAFQAVQDSSSTGTVSFENGVEFTPVPTTGVTAEEEALATAAAEEQLARSRATTAPSSGLPWGWILLAAGVAGGVFLLSR
jgi:hypothetical protein